MPEKKTLVQLRLEKERAELRLAHELCNIGGTVESLAPVFKGLPKQEMYELLETVFSLPEVQHTLRNFASRKEDAEHGYVPFHSRPD